MNTTQQNTTNTITPDELIIEALTRERRIAQLSDQT